MEIHKFEKWWLAAGLLLIVGFIVTIVYGATGPGIAMMNDQGGQVDSTAIQNGQYNQTDEFESPGVRQVDENNYTAHVVARQFLFEPGTNEPITVPANSTVTFYVTSPDVIHGFSLVGTNINTMVIPGQVAQFTTEFNETGEYGIVCHEYCGAAHHTMAGKVRVVPQSEFNESTLEGT
jgi:cytochrome c oxidase subunit 2